MIQAAGQVVPLKLDVDRREVGPIANKYSVSAIPAIFVLDAGGKVLGAIEASDPAAFASQLNRIVKKHKVGSSAVKPAAKG